MDLSASLLPLSGRTVLVVEDSATQRAHAVALISKLGAMQVLEGSDGLEGLKRLAEVPAIDLVLSDLEMPHMDGVTFIGEFAARGFRPELIVLSSQDLAVLHSVHLMAETYGLTVPGIIPKPLTQEALQNLFPAKPLASSVHPPSGPTLEKLSIAEIAAGIRGGELLCYFQPQITLKGALLKGVEALVRWRHPGAGLLGPGAFLPQVETDEGLMFELTMEVLAKVAEQWHGWRRRGLAIEVSVNLSALTINTPGFADRLMAAADRLELPPKALVFELTESASVSHLGHTLANLARLRMRGFKLSIDDFGTGFATFEQLERIPFTELKLDRSIVKDLPHSQQHLVLVESMLQMAQGMKLTTVAEGIETLESWRSLREMGCDRGQGFLLARPMPGDQLMEWAKQDRAWLRT